MHKMEKQTFHFQTKGFSLNFSFSGFKTSVLYHLRKQQQLDEHYIQNHRDDLCASVQHTLVNILIEKT
ncbi:MAG: hypothetical protein CM15mP83_8330 [Flavobacteriaceae bacterium]|nr:MAG: hypothetical protein CM15mP83_8330 [Flavobacteriaceae bacterium]